MSETVSPPEVTCPGCSGVDWAHDGFGLRASGSRIDVGRFAPPGEDSGDWHCRSCGEPLEDEAVAGALTLIEHVHEVP